MLIPVTTDTSHGCLDASVQTAAGAPQDDVAVDGITNSEDPDKTATLAYICASI